MYITNNPKISYAAQRAGVDWIFIDLEVNGKELRQKGLNSVISFHNLNDINIIKKTMTTSKLLVRINPIHDNSLAEINEVIKRGADTIMLPFFNSLSEVKYFLKVIALRIKVCLLVETPSAVDILQQIILLNNIDYIYIGLNDLHIAYKKKFMFELLVDGTVSKIINLLKSTNIEYGFGGLARLGNGIIPSEKIIMEHYKYSSNLAILSRSFLNQNEDLVDPEIFFSTEIKKIREFEKSIESCTVNDFEKNHQEIKNIIYSILHQ
jgi:hypothetical protein